MFCHELPHFVTRSCVPPFHMINSSKLLIVLRIRGLAVVQGGQILLLRSRPRAVVWLPRQPAWQPLTCRRQPHVFWSPENRGLPPIFAPIDHVSPPTFQPVHGVKKIPRADEENPEEKNVKQMRERGPRLRAKNHGARSQFHPVGHDSGVALADVVRVGGDSRCGPHLL